MRRAAALAVAVSEGRFLPDVSRACEHAPLGAATLALPQPRVDEASDQPRLVTGTAPRAMACSR